MIKNNKYPNVNIDKHFENVKINRREKNYLVALNTQKKILYFCVRCTDTDFPRNIDDILI